MAVANRSEDRDSARWKLSPEETKLRRSLFWEVFVYDSWQSLTYGRPPSLSMAHIECKMAHETTKNPAGDVEMSCAYIFLLRIINLTLSLLKSMLGSIDSLPNVLPSCMIRFLARGRLPTRP